MERHGPRAGDRVGSLRDVPHRAAPRLFHAALRDVGVLQRAGVPAGPDGRVDATRVVNAFAKAEASPDGRVRGERHTMLDDTDISATRHARAAVGGLIAGVAGTGAIYVSGGAEHQGPAGGGPIAVIARVNGAA